MTEDGKPYGPERFKTIVKERWLIAKNCNTSYIDTGKLTPIERDYIMDFMIQNAKETVQAMEKAKTSK